MAKTLLVLRHGKSRWDQPVDDHDRGLKKRGKRDTLRMGREIRERNLLPDAIFSSTAKRARSTAQRVAESASFSEEIVMTRDLYFKGVEPHLVVISEASDSCQRVMVVGHNPDMEDLIEELTGEFVTMPTCALACIQIEIESWNEVTDAQGKVQLVLRPRDL